MMSKRRLFSLPALLLAVSIPTFAGVPRIGDQAPDFTLPAVNGGELTLSSLTAHGSVVLVVLRGYPGYQCPFSQQQFEAYEQAAASFAVAGAEVVFVYPGTGGQDLLKNARQLAGPLGLPAHTHMVVDPDYQFTTQYGLRWQAADQTAYPSTFLVSRKGLVFFAHTGRTSSDQTPATEALAALVANTTAQK
jgi:peroxiredoxin